MPRRNRNATDRGHHDAGPGVLQGDWVTFTAWWEDFEAWWSQDRAKAGGRRRAPQASPLGKRLAQSAMVSTRRGWVSL